MNRSEIMAAIRSKDTTPEILVRKVAHGMGYRYRLHHPSLPGRPDLAFVGRKKALFIHGCFWHQHARCRDGHMPNSNATYWKPKLERNVRRDAEYLAALKAMGWSVLIIWECETENPECVRSRLRRFLG